jgi:hypothetical protein
LKEEHKLKVPENRALGGTLGRKGDEVTGEWRKLHNEELHVFLTQYCAGDKIKKNEMDGAFTSDGVGERRV